MKKIIGLFIIISLAACDLTKEIDYQTLCDSEWIVINGFISKDHGVNVIVKKSVAPNNPTIDDQIDSPQVSLICNERTIAQLIKYEDNKYRLENNLDLSSDSVYKIKVEAGGFKTVISDGQRLLPKTLVDTAYILRDTVNRASYIYFEFNDVGNEADYFTYRFDYYNDGIVESMVHQFLPAWAFTDEGFTNQRITKFERLSSIAFDSVKISLYTVSEFYYQFIQSYLDYEISNKNYYYETIFPVATNIENGFGFFCSYEVDEYSLINKYKKKYYE